MKPVKLNRPANRRLPMFVVDHTGFFNLRVWYHRTVELIGGFTNASRWDGGWFDQANGQYWLMTTNCRMAPRIEVHILLPWDTSRETIRGLYGHLAYIRNTSLTFNIEEDLNDTRKDVFKIHAS